MSSIIRADRWQDSNGVAYNAVLQVLSTTKTDTFTTTSTSFADITGLSVAITPRFATSKILVVVMMYGGSTATGGGVGGHVALLRDSTQIALGDAAGSRFRSFASISANFDTQQSSFLGGTFLDSPNTTSAITYKVQTRVNGAWSAVIGRNGNDADSTATPRMPSTITVMEIAQ